MQGNVDKKTIDVTLAEGKKVTVPVSPPLFDLYLQNKGVHKYTVVAARVDNYIKELSFELNESCKVEFIDLADEDGMRIYRRSLHFLLIKAVHDLFPDRKVVISHSISKGIYCEVKGNKELTHEEVKMIEEQMRRLVKKKLPFIKSVMSIENARRLLIKDGREDRFNAVEHRSNPLVTIYNCDGLEDYFYGYMLPDTGYISLFSLIFYNPGLIIMFPDKSNPNLLPDFSEKKKLFSIFNENKKWGYILGVVNVGDLNDIVIDGGISNIIRVSEALHEKKIANIADMVLNGENKKRLILISGPSSSGKTTFAQRLAIQLWVNGLRPVTISLDDYFVDREDTPKDENGDYDYENLEAIDIKLFNENLADLIRGNEVELPLFDFSKGSRKNAGRNLRITDDNILVIEGIHGLNEKLTASISKEDKFKIYVSALTSMNIDNHNRIPTTDTRLIRRIARDYQFRGSSAVETLKRWSSVRYGEEKNIFPFQEEADIMFNSALVYELGVLKTIVEPLLNEIDNTNYEFSEARRLIDFLSYFLPIDSDIIANNSIIREFIGNSCFYTH